MPANTTKFFHYSDLWTLQERTTREAEQAATAYQIRYDVFVAMLKEHGTDPDFQTELATEWAEVAEAERLAYATENLAANIRRTLRHAERDFAINDANDTHPLDTSVIT